MDLHQRVKYYCNLNKITQSELAKRVGFSVVGFNKSLKKETLPGKVIAQIAEIFNVSVNELLEDDFNGVVQEPTAPYRRLNESERLELVEKKVHELEKQLKEWMRLKK